MSGGHPAELTWMRHLAGELGPVERLRFRAHLRRCEACRAREVEVGLDRAQVEPELTPGLDRLLAAVRVEPVERVGRRRPPWGWALASGVGLAALVVVVRLGTGPADEALRARGSTSIEYFLDRGTRSTPLGVRCAPGDRLMARYRAEGYLAVLERDGTGRVQVLFPAGANTAAAVGGVGTTPTSWVLDDVPGEECFAAFFSAAPFDVASAVAALSAGSPRLPGVDVQVRCCAKDPRP